jgi:hypothetical protein
MLEDSTMMGFAAELPDPVSIGMDAKSACISLNVRQVSYPDLKESVFWFGVVRLGDLPM